MSRARPRPRSGERSKAVIAGVIGSPRSERSCLLAHPFFAALQFGLARLLRRETAGRHFSSRFIGGEDDSLVRHEMISEPERSGARPAVEDALALTQQDREGHQDQ